MYRQNRTTRLTVLCLIFSLFTSLFPMGAGLVKAEEAANPPATLSEEAVDSDQQVPTEPEPENADSVKNSDAQAEINNADQTSEDSSPASSQKESEDAEAKNSDLENTEALSEGEKAGEANVAGADERFASADETVAAEKSAPEDEAAASSEETADQAAGQAESEEPKAEEPKAEEGSDSEDQSASAEDENPASAENMDPKETTDTDSAPEDEALESNEEAELPADEANQEEIFLEQTKTEQAYKPLGSDLQNPDAKEADALAEINQPINDLAAKTLAKESSTLQTSYKIDLTTKDDKGNEKQRSSEDRFQELFDIVEKIKAEAQDAEDNIFTIDLNGGSYTFSKILDLSGKLSQHLTFQIINTSEQAAILHRAAGFTKTMIKVGETGKLILGQVDSPHGFTIKNNTVGTVTYTETTKTQEGKFVYNNIVFDGQNRNDRVNGHPLVLDIQGEAVINGAEIKNFDNGSSGNAYDSSPIRVEGSKNHIAKLTINDINIHDNTFRQGAYDGHFATSALNIQDHSDVVMNGGQIHDNTSTSTTILVGGKERKISSDGPNANFTLNDGEIYNNQIEYTGLQFGGGVTVLPNGNFTMNGGEIYLNQAYHGGGVYVSSRYTSGQWNYKCAKTEPGVEADREAVFTMNGGEISGNLAQAKNVWSGSGGGLYVDSSYVTINAGKFLGNQAENMGGGIYISTVPIHFTLKNALITQNEAHYGDLLEYPSGYGGGYWHCPTGAFQLNAKDGNIVWNNKAAGGGSDIYTWEKPDSFELNDTNITNELITKLSLLDRYGRLIDYQSENPYNNLFCTDNTASFTLNYDQASLDQAWSELPVLIMGNIALKGGGVGSNANVDFGEPEPSKWRIEVDKSWDHDLEEQLMKEQGKLPEVQVDLYIGKYQYGHVNLNESNNWHGTFDNLPFTRAQLEELSEKNQIDLRYNVREHNDDYYAAVEEYTQQLKLKREWLPEDHSWYKNDSHSPDTKNFVQIVYEDKNGQTAGSYIFNLSAKNSGDPTLDWTTYLQHEIFNHTDKDKLYISYYGYDKSPHDSPDWSKYKGIDNRAYKESEPHTIYVRDLGDGKLALRLPYLWIQRGTTSYKYNYNYADNTIGYRVDLENCHRFHITNYAYTEIPIEKLWDESVKASDRPSGVRFYLTNSDGTRYRDQDGNYRYVDLNDTNGWKGRFEKLPPYQLLKNAKDIFQDFKFLTLKPGQDFPYSVEEVSLKQTNNNGKIVYKEIDKERRFLPLVENLRSYYAQLGLKLERKTSISLEDEQAKPYLEKVDKDGKPLGKPTFGDDTGEYYFFNLFDDYNVSLSDIRRIPFILEFYNSESDRIARVPTGGPWRTNMEQHGNIILWKYFYAKFENIPLEGIGNDADIGDEIKIKHVLYYDENGNNFPRNFGEYENDKGKNVITPGIYVLQLVKGEDGNYTLYVPALTPQEFNNNDIEKNLLSVATSIQNPAWRWQFKVTNYAAPKHKIEVSKNWETEDNSEIPENLTITVTDAKGIAQDLNLVLDEAGNWTYEGQEIVGWLKDHSYQFTEEEIQNFTQDLDKSKLEYRFEFQLKPQKPTDGSASDQVSDAADHKILTALWKDSQTPLTAQDMDEILRSGKYSYKLLPLSEAGPQIFVSRTAKGGYLIEYTVDVIVTEVAHMNFTNVRTPEPEEPEEPHTPHKPHTPPESTKPPVDTQPIISEACIKSLPKTAAVNMQVDDKEQKPMTTAASSILILSAGLLSLLMKASRKSH